MTKWLGIDVGGANLKVSDAKGYAVSYPFELWNHRDELTDAIANALAAAPAWDALAATMTGELADCYETKADGVQHISASLSQAVGPRQLAIYGVDGRFGDPNSMSNKPLLAAASNWHALARYASSWLPNRSGMVVDIGSTTADIIPVREGQVATSSQTDTDRLLAGELVYTGVGRTPVCAVVSELPFLGKKCPVAAELFATTADVYRLLELSNDEQAATADGRELTLAYSIDRFARQVCADRETFSHADAVAAAEYVRRSQRERLQWAFDQVACQADCDSLPTVVSGSGEFLAQQVVAGRPMVTEVISLSDTVGIEQSHCAAATAVAYLAAQEC